MVNINISDNYSHMINAIVFDLDETIGYFSQLYTIWDTLITICDDLTRTQHQQLFNIVLDTFDNYMRPLIMSIFKYLKNKKMKTKNVAVMIYTNNNGPKVWTMMIKDYIHHKLNFELFDNIICAFKVDGKIVEPLRTTQQKTYSDLIRCTSMPLSTKIFFIDDQYHERMKHENIYYIKIKPYVYHYSFSVILEKLKSRDIMQFIKKHCTKTDATFISKFKELYTAKYTDYTTDEHLTHKTVIEQNVDASVGKQIIAHLKDFFFDVIESKQTRKNIKKYQHSKTAHPHKNRTRKKYINGV